MLMSKILTILWRNKLYLALLIFVISINLVVFVAEKTAEVREREKSGKTVQEKSSDLSRESMFNEEDIKAREEKLKNLSESNPGLYVFIGLVNLAIMFFIFIGILLDGYFLRRFLRKNPLLIRTAEPGECRWDLFDVARVALIFLSCGYVFMIAEGFAAEHVPIFMNDNFRMVTSTAVINIVGISVMLYFVVKKYGQKIASLGLTAKKAAANFFTR